MKTQRIATLAVGTVLAITIGLGGLIGRADAKDPTQSRWYRTTNWVDHPRVQRFMTTTQQMFRDNKQVIKGTAKRAVRGESPGKLILKGLFGYPKEAK